MKIGIPEILTSIKGIVTNTAIMVKTVLFLVVCTACFVVGSNYYSKAKSKPCEDCSGAKAQVQQLINALIEIRSGVKSMAEATNYYPMDEGITVMYARYDSIPKRKNRPTQQQVKFGLMINRIDSIIARAQMQQRQIKN